MADLESVIRGLEEFRDDLKPFAGNRADWQKVDNTLEILQSLDKENRELREKLEGVRRLIEKYDQV